MIIFVAAALVASVSAKADTATICEVGRIALRDLPKINNNPSFDTYYAGVSRYHRDLLEACPTLVVDLPVGYPLADDDARSRANLPAPIPGRPVREAFVYFIKPPKISGTEKQQSLKWVTFVPDYVARASRSATSSQQVDGGVKAIL